MRTAAELRVRLTANVHGAETAAMRADNDAIQQAAGELASPNPMRNRAARP